MHHPASMRLLLVLALAVASCQAEIILRELSSVYLPYDYASDGQGLFGLGTGASEQSAYDSEHAIVYTVGDRHMHILDYSNTRTPIVLHHARLPSTGNDVEICGGLVAVAADGQPGTVELYRYYDQQTNQLPFVSSISVGSRPDMLKFTHDCQTIVVANEGEPYEESGYIIDNEGTVSIIHLSNLDAIQAATTLDFKSFNARADEYVRRGVRWPYRGELGRNPNTLSQSLEPEYITFNKEDTKAYICLQENNAVAVLDLVSETIMEIYPLGFKSWKDILLDASDKDSGISFASYDIYSMYQPDSIKYMEVDGVGYIVTANEGADMKFQTDSGKWRETQRGKDFVDDNQLSSSVPSEVRSALADNDKLGRLQFSTVDGRNPQNTNQFDRLYFYGSRSVSIFRADDFSLVYDSGDEIEREHVVVYPEIFNADYFSDDLDKESPEDTFDSRSDNKGTEPEAVELGEVNGTRVLFLANERTSTLMIYSFEGNSVTPVFQSIQRFGGSKDSFSDLYDKRNTGNLDPEDLSFIPASDNPSGKPLLLVTSTRSGTVSIYEVAEAVDTNNNPGAIGGSEGMFSIRIVLTVSILSLIGSLLSQ